MKPINVRIQNCSTHAGIEQNPVICWNYGNQEGDRVQQSCRIFIMQGLKIIYDSKKMKTNRQNNHRIPLQLETHKRYQILVEAEDGDGVCETSECVSFISGICRQEDWSGRWISDGSRRPHYLGTEIIIEKPVAYAFISLAGIGQYEVKINEKKPDSSVLNGSWTDYNKRIHYRTFEISSLLKTGENSLTIEVGNGWYAPVIDERHFYTWDKGYEPFGNCLCAVASLTIVFEDGEVFRTGTDERWWSKKSETIYTNVYGSEDYDAGVSGTDEKRQAILLTGDELPKGKLVPMQYPPIVIKRVYNGNLVCKFEDGSLLYDLGQNMSGLFEINVRGERGVTLRMTPVEKLYPDGSPWKTVETWCTYTLKGNKEGERWMPKFTYGAGRYIHIRLEQECDTCQMPRILGVSGYFITSSSEDTGSFICSDNRYMQVHDLVLRAIESNLHHIHTDCPTIERLGWQEPNHLMGPSVMYAKNVDTLWDKIAKDQIDSQYQAGEFDIDCGAFPHNYGPGLVTSIAPRYARFLVDCGQGSFWDIIPWGSSILLAAYEQYRFYGNKITLTDNYEAAKKYVDYQYQKYCDYGTIYDKGDGVNFLCHGLGDWGIRQNQGESRENIETAYLYQDMMILSEVAGWLGKRESEDYKKLAEEICRDYNKQLLVKNPVTGEWIYKVYGKEDIIATQAAQAIPLCFDMVPEDKMPSVQRSFLYTCSEHVLYCGEIGLPYILRTLGEMEQADIVHDMILNSGHPGYYRFIQNGETTLPEFWRDDARSRNHDMMGAILEYFYRYLAGISSEDGFRTIHIKPILPTEMDYMNCTYRSIAGDVKIEVRRVENGKMQVKAELPVNTTGKIILDGCAHYINGGKLYCFE